MTHAVQSMNGKRIPAAKSFLLLMLIVGLAACGEARIVQREDYVPAHRDTAMHPIAGRGEYVVVRGDTLYGIAFRNGMDFRELAAINGIEAPYTIYVDQLLRLRGEHVRTPRRPSSAVAAPNPPPSPSTSVHTVRVEPLPDTRPMSQTKPSQTSAANPSASSLPAVTLPTTSPTAHAPIVATQPPAPISMQAAQAPPPPVHAAPSAAVIPAVSAPIGGIGWRWPVKGNVIDRFMAGDATHQGVDIAGSDGDPVLSAGDGVVVYSGSGLVGYGELIIIKHSDEWLSAYGHNRKRLVQEGQRVRAGQQIAEMGHTGANRDMLHFEIRRNGRPVDPQQYLPQR
jgi:lipoprotein NlpD